MSTSCSTRVRHGLLTPEVAEQAVQRAVDAVDGLARNGYDLQRWLAGKRHGTHLARPSAAAGQFPDPVLG